MCYHLVDGDNWITKLPFRAAGCDGSVSFSFVFGCRLSVVGFDCCRYLTYLCVKVRAKDVFLLDGCRKDKKTAEA